MMGLTPKTVYNIDWPSRKGLPAATQQVELRGMLDKLAALHFNAVIFQVRPECDALYRSSREPWSAWLTGTQGKSPGYDPLRFCIGEAHARGIEVHAWFNPFRARCNNATPVAASHVTRADPASTRAYGSMTWCDPSSGVARSRVLDAIMDVVRRYDIDGVHLDDYFYPYPKGGLVFGDGKLDYLAPQLYWRISPRKQSFPSLLAWWREQGSRPVWPGIATARIDSSEDPGRPASEIINQIAIARKSPDGLIGHIHWSAKSVATNRGGIASALKDTYRQAVVVPAMPWLSTNAPAIPEITANTTGSGVLVTWKPTSGLAKIAIQARSGGTWRTAAIRCSSSGSLRIPQASAVAATAIDRFGAASPARIAIVR